MITRIAVLLCALAAGSAQAESYIATSLGFLPGFTSSSQVYDINRSGVVVGSSYKASYSQISAFKYSASSGMVQLPGLVGSTFTSALGINDLGQVVGYSGTSGAVHAVLWDQYNNITDLGTFPGENGSQAFSINNNGQVVGRGGYGGNDRAFLWEGAGLSFIGPSSSGASQYSYAYDINDAGVAIGLVKNNSQVRAFKVEDGVTSFLPSLPSTTPKSIATALNDLGQIVGLSNTSAGDRAVMWSGSSVINLGSLPTAVQRSAAADINNKGIVVGWSGTGSGAGDKAFVWSAEGGMLDLNALVDINSLSQGFVLSSAVAINDDGLIAVNGYMNGVAQTFLLTPVPEPETYAMFLAGLGLIAVFVRSNRKKFKNPLSTELPRLSY